ncbi:MAG: hypothetical protein LGR52_13610 [Candidatus Thiosymbion ectosymbiont of Robbea hypermnestra]|nr:hypothetical protein [Candidatus Thiosymbion ectosymbiont of Robbea hypermnestra]
MTIIICNFEESLVSNLQALLNSKSSECRKLLYQFFNIQKKRIFARPRQVHISSELAQHQLYRFEKKSVISEIINKIKNGDDLNIYLSDKQNELDHIDLTLTVMGIHHFHLGDTIVQNGKRKGLVKGTKSLLFIKIEQQDAYFIDILSHDINTGFLNRRLLSIIYKNWPILLEDFRIDRENIKCREITDEEFSMVIQHRINTTYSPEEGVAYFLPGQLTSANTDSDNEDKISRFLTKLNDIEKSLKAKPDAIAKYIKNITGVKYNVLRFPIEIIDNCFVIKNVNSGIRWDLYMLPNGLWHIRPGSR